MSKKMMDNKLKWMNLINFRWGVVGVARVARGYAAPLHRHPFESIPYEWPISEASLLSRL